MRIIFCGSGTFALVTLEALIESNHEVVAVVTQPPRKAGRGSKLRATPVEIACQQHGIEVFPCEDINAPSSVEYLQFKKPDVICVVEYGQFLRKAVREIPTIDTFNLHGSVLPELRGAAPVNWAILRGDKTAGVSTFSLVDKMDAGPVYLTDEIKLDSDERADSLREKLAQLGARTVLRTLDQFAAGTAKAIEQDSTEATFAPRMKKSDGILNFDLPAEHLDRIIRGTWPWPGAQAEFRRLNGKVIPVTIAKARVVDSISDVEPGLIEPDLCIATGEKRLEILEIKPAGKRLMTWKDFCNGYRVKHGGRFCAPERK